MSAVAVDSHAALASVAGQLAETADLAGRMFVLTLVPADGGQRVAGHLAFRLADPPSAAYAVRVAARAAGEVAGQDGLCGVFLVAYGPARAADPLVDVTAETIAALTGLTVIDALRIDLDAGRCWSYACDCDEPGHRPGQAGMAVDLLSDTAIELATEIGRQQ